MIQIDSSSENTSLFLKKFNAAAAGKRIHHNLLLIADFLNNWNMKL